VLTLVTALMLLLGTRSAGAQIPSGAGLAPERLDANAAGPLSVWIESDATGLDAEGLRVALSRELGRDVEISRDAKEAVVKIRVAGAHAAVSYRTPAGEQLSRAVELPGDSQRSLEVVTWLTVNLVRDEASELLEELRARRKAEAEARAAAERDAAEKAAAERALAEKAAAEEALRAAERKRAAQAPSAANTGAGTPNPPKDELLRDPLRSMDLAFVTPLSLLRDSERRLLRLQLALVYGASGAIQGVAAGPGVLRIRRDLQGIAGGAAAVLVGGDARGIIAAGFAAVSGKTEGVMIGAGFVNGHSFRGIAASGGADVFRGVSQGLQIAGGVNVSGDLHGVALAALNVTRDLDGLAIGAVNVQHRVKGLSIGVVNVAEQVDGAALGVVSVAKNGRVQPLLWASSDGAIHAAVKSIAGVAFTQLGAGIEPSGNHFSYDGGVGLHLKLGARFFVEPGVHYRGVSRTSSASGAPDEHQLHYLLQAGLRLGRAADVLVGGGLRHSLNPAEGQAALAMEGVVGLAFF
jgi:hypothetical protein